jgi:hypothetical protein
MIALGDRPRGQKSAGPSGLQERTSMARIVILLNLVAVAGSGLANSGEVATRTIQLHRLKLAHGQGQSHEADDRDCDGSGGPRILQSTLEIMRTPGRTRGGL